MTAPFFYIKDYKSFQKEVVLDEDISRHIVQVLRMRRGDNIHVTDGKGNLMCSEIIDNHKKRCTVKIIDSRFIPQPSRKITIAISLIKNSNRFEWFLEKVTEIGVTEIIPLICQRTEKEKFRIERMQGIIISAMLQSQQSWLPTLYEPVVFDKITGQAQHQQKFIAHCIQDQKRNLADLVNESLSSQIILIGPEGDFTKEEVELAVENHFIPVSLGDTRLRTETAGIVAATLLRII